MPHAVSNVKHVALDNVVPLNTPTRAERFVWRDQVIASGVSPSALLVALLLVDHFNLERGNVAWPSHAKLAERSHLTDRTVRTALAELERAGFIENERAGGGSRRDEAGILRGRTGLYRMTTRK